MKSKFSRGFAWVLMALVLVGIIGFGKVNFGGSASTLGTVGSTKISADRYFREMRAELNAFQSQYGQNITFAQAQAMGLDQQVLSRLLASVALEDETARLGLSVGDAEIARRVRDIDAFKGLDGKFSRENYDYALTQSGLTASEFEASLRSEVSRAILDGAVTGGVALQPVYADTIWGWARETRDFTWARVDATALEAPVGTPDEATLQAYYAANPAAFTLPETKQITYVLVTPDDVLGEIDVPEDELRTMYAERADQYSQPERRLVERLVFSSETEAEVAASRIANGSASFEDLVAERGLELGDIDLGDVTEGELGSAGAEVFAAEAPGVVGPLDSSLGPALYRVNAVLPAQETPFDTVRDELKAEYAADAARRLLADRMSSFDDELAGGATLEDLAKDMSVPLGKLAWSEGSTEGPAAYDGFRAAAQAVTEDDYPEMAQLSDGAIFALRLDSTDAPRLQSLDEVRAQAVSGWQAEETQRQVAAAAEAMVAKFAEGETPASLGLTEVVETEQERNAFIDGTPAALIADVFEMAPGDWRVVEDTEGAVLVRLDAVNAADQTGAEAVAAKASYSAQMAQELGLDIQSAFAAALETRAGVTLDRAMINAVNANFP